MNVAIIKYNAGNIFSVDYALKRLGVEPIITADAELLQKADKIIFPGVGEAKNTMQYLEELHLDRLIKDLKQPVLGICLGMQLMCRHSEEGDVDCLGIFDADVLKFSPTRHEDKVPHVGWNQLGNLEKALFKDVDSGSFVYYVHSYYANLCPDTIATTKHGLLFSAALKYENFYGTQFHPEKSGDVGERILKNFLERC